MSVHLVQARNDKNIFVRMLEGLEQRRTNVDEVLGYSARKERKINRKRLYLHTPTVLPLDGPLFSLPAWLTPALSLSLFLRPATATCFKCTHIIFRFAVASEHASWKIAFLDFCFGYVMLLMSIIIIIIIVKSNAPLSHRTHSRNTFEFRASFSNTIWARCLGTRRTHVHTKSFTLIVLSTSAYYYWFCWPENFSRVRIKIDEWFLIWKCDALRSETKFTVMQSNIEWRRIGKFSMTHMSRLVPAMQEARTMQFTPLSELGSVSADRFMKSSLNAVHSSAVGRVFRWVARIIPAWKCYSYGNCTSSE